MTKPKLIESFVYALLQSRGKKIIVILIMFIALASSIWLVVSTNVKVKLLPNQFADHFSLYIDLPEDSKVYQTKEVTKCISNILKKEKIITDFSIFLGETGPVDFSAMIKGRIFQTEENNANILVNLKKEDDREETSIQAVHRLRPIIQKNCSMHNANIKFIQSPAGPPYLASLVLEIASDEPYKNIEKLAYKIKPFFAKIKGVEDIDILTDSDVTRYEVVLDNEKIIKSYLEIKQVKQILYTAFEGLNIAYTNETNIQSEIPIHLVLDKKSKNFKKDNKNSILEKLAELKLLNPKGMQIPLSELVTIKKVQKGKTIKSKNLYPIVEVIAETDNISQIYALLDIRDLIIENLSKDYEIKTVGLLDLDLIDKKSKEIFHLHWDGEQKTSWDTVTDLSKALGAAIVLIFFMMVIYYKNFSLATSVVLASFISIVGVIYMHWIWDILSSTPFYMTGTSLIGFIALIGINSRNSLLIIDFTKQLIEQKGLEVDRAIAISTNTRAKPILLTVLAIVFASALLTLDPVFGGLGVALIGGTLIAYLVSLFVVPIFIQRTLHKIY